MSGITSKIADLLRTVAGNNPSNHFTSAIIVAGGNSSRMGGDTTKQMMELGGLSVIARTLIAFQRSEYIKEIIVVAKADEKDYYSQIKEQYKLSKLAAIAEGGATRQESVMNGFAKISEKADFVAIHDGARCFVTEEIIESVLKSAFKYNAACAASRMRDTAKYADSNGFIEYTVDRDHLWRAQTPQVFKTNLYRAAAYTAMEKGISVTDDCMLAESAGFKVKLVDCGEDNIKITVPGDLDIGKTILAKRGELL